MRDKQAYARAALPAAKMFKVFPKWVPWALATLRSMAVGWRFPSPLSAENRFRKNRALGRGDRRSPGHGTRSVGTATDDFTKLSQLG